MREQRKHPRMLCAEIVELIYRESTHFERRRIVNLEDISLCGACLHLDEQLPEGTPVVIRYGDGRLVGAVRYCLYRDESYFVGVEFDEGCRWSTLHFRPEHLLDPRQLVETVVQRRTGHRNTL